MGHRFYSVLLFIILSLLVACGNTDPTGSEDDLQGRLLLWHPFQGREAVGQAHPEVKANPKPTAFLASFGDSSIDFKLGVWIRNPVRIAPITSDLNRAIWKAFAENDIEIPFPQQDVHIRSRVSWEKEADAAS